MIKGGNTDEFLGQVTKLVDLINYQKGSVVSRTIIDKKEGTSRWAYGSVADKIFRASCVPIFMVRAPGCVPGI